jgi:hypothetical protein
MPNPDTQPPEIFGAEHGGNVFETVAGEAAAELELDTAGRQIELVVRNQNVSRSDS